jgi:hypothetical protein
LYYGTEELRENTTQPRTNVLPLCLPDPVSQVGVDLHANSTTHAVLHANYVFQEFSSLDSAHNERYHLIGHAVPKEDGDFLNLV